MTPERLERVRAIMSEMRVLKDGMEKRLRLLELELMADQTEDILPKGGT